MKPKTKDMKPVKIGVIGCGDISRVYLEQCRQFSALEVVAVADLLPERAQARAVQYGVARACTVDELLADPEIEIVVNLTIPLAHGVVALAVLKAGKSVYNEKPLAYDMKEAKQMLMLARRKGLLIGGAPDTFLGAGYQTCRELIDNGAIGRPLSAAGFMMCSGHESWHPNPEFYYKPGGGPMFDMGPYYLTGLVSLLGPIARVSGSTQIGTPVRTATSQARMGEQIVVETATHIAGTLDFVSGVVATLREGEVE